MNKKYFTYLNFLVISYGRYYKHNTTFLYFIPSFNKHFCLLARL